MTIESLRERFFSGEPVLTSELVPPRGADAAAVYAQVEQLAFADALNITDLPQARTRMSALAAAALVVQAGGRPILALSPRLGVAADFLASGGGVLAEPEDAAGIAAALERLHDLWRAGCLSELAPGPEQAAPVSAAAVVPVYERAFREAAQ